METTITIARYDSQLQELIIGGHNCKKGTYITIEERNPSFGCYYVNQYKYELEYEEDKFIVNIDISSLKDTFVNGRLYDVFLVNENGKIPVSLAVWPEWEMDATFFEDSNYQIQPYKNLRSNLSIRVVNRVKVIVTKMSYIDDENLLINFEIKQSNIDLSQEQVKVVVKRRESRNLLLYSDIIEFESYKNNNGSYSAVVSTLKLYQNNEVFTPSIWDCYMEVLDPTGIINRIKINFPNKVVSELQFKELRNNPFLEVAFQINKQGKFQLVTRYKSYDTAYTMEIENDENVILTINIDDISYGVRVNRIYMRPRVFQKDAQTIFDPIDLPILSNDINEKEVLQLADIVIKSKFNLELLFINQQKEDKLINDFYIELIDKATETVTEIPLKTSLTGKTNKFRLAINEYFDGILYTTSDETLALSISKQLKKHVGNKINIGIFGSCYSRVAFTSSSYFNPDYKERYKVVLNQFQSSIASIMSQPVEFDNTYFSDLVESEVKKVRSDFEKCFFKELSETKLDYLIIDLYADTTLDLLVFDEEHIITGTNQIQKSIDYLNNIKQKAKIITHENKGEFFAYWKPALHRFIEEVKKYIPEEKIIFQKARMNQRYYDRNGKVQAYSDSMQELIQRTNYYYSIMEREVLKLIPKAKIIDINSFGYFGNQKFPFGHSSNHYESAYYREFMKQLDNIVIQDFIKNNN